MPGRDVSIPLPPHPTPHPTQTTHYDTVLLLEKFPLIFYKNNLFLAYTLLCRKNKNNYHICVFQVENIRTKFPVWFLLKNNLDWHFGISFMFKLFITFERKNKNNFKNNFTLNRQIFFINNCLDVLKN